MWFALWSLLVVGTLVGAFFLARRLWFSVRDLGVELARAAEVIAQLSAKVDELQRIAEATRQARGPDLFGDRHDLWERVQELRVQRAGRRQERVLRRIARARTWRAYWS